MVLRSPDLKHGASYEHTYGNWLKFFRDCAEDPGPVDGVPMSWAPFLTYLSCTVTHRVHRFDADNYAPSAAAITGAVQRGRLRELVESTSALRPELVDALYKSDVVWATVHRVHPMRADFVVTCNGSFWRPEVLAYIDELRRYTPPAAKLTVIVPCAADKPYPAMLHREVMRIARGAQIVIATGVLGLIPMGLWDAAPNYDSGLPNELRVRDEVARYFSRVPAEVTGRVILYSDFYAPCVATALADVGVSALWPRAIAAAVLRTPKLAVREDHAHVEYINLLDDRYLNVLREEVSLVSG